MSRTHRSLVALYVLGLALFALCCVAGIVYALTQERSAPSLILGYPPHIDRLAAEKRWEEALEQMHRAALIEKNNPGLYRKFAQLSAALGDSERVLFAGRSWARLDPTDPEAHATLCEALLEGLIAERLDAEQLALVEEAMEHGKALIVLEPQSPRGHQCLGMALVLRGSHSGAPRDFIQGGARLARALELDPKLDRVRSWLHFARSRSGS